MIFPSRVHGIPCQVEVTRFRAGTPLRVTGTGMGDAEPPEPPEIEFRLLDRRGKPAGWLEKKLDPPTTQEIHEEIRVMKQGEMLDY